MINIICLIMCIMLSASVVPATVTDINFNEVYVEIEDNLYVFYGDEFFVGETIIIVMINDAIVDVIK